MGDPIIFAPYTMCIDNQYPTYLPIPSYPVDLFPLRPIAWLDGIPPNNILGPLLGQFRQIAKKEGNKMYDYDTSDMSQDELDEYSRLCNDQDEYDLDDWANAHNPNNENYIGG